MSASAFLMALEPAVAIQLGLVGAAVLWAMWIAHFLLFRGNGLAEWVGLVLVVQNIVGSLFIRIFSISGRAASMSLVLVLVLALPGAWCSDIGCRRWPAIYRHNRPESA